MALNADDILKEQFPDNVSVSDLCDCGKHKRRHHGPPPIPKKSCPLPDSDYRATFQGVSQRPRSSKRPLTDVPRAKLPKEPMFFDTNQRADFKSHGQIERTKPIIPDLYGSAIFQTASRKVQHGRRISRSEEMFEPSSAKVDGTTSYTAEFIPKELQQELRRVAPRPNYIPSDAKFENRTTNKEHYKKWVPTKQVPFGEMPTFTGSILYPKMKERAPETETQNCFKGEFVKRPDAIRFADNNMKIEGDMFMNTTNHDTFTKHSGDHRARRTTHTPTLKVGKLGKIETQTQNRRDFPQYRDPERAIPAEPAPCTIDLKFDNKRSLTTEQRDIFKGHDVLINPMAKALRTDYADYEPPTVKFETQTSNKRDYVPKEIPKTLLRPVPREGQIQRSRDDVKFDDRTMMKDFFKNWGPSNRVRYGDFHENRPYIPPQTKFDGTSVTKTCFIPKKFEPVKDFKPEYKPVAQEGDIDFQTVHRQTYIQPVVKPCRAHLFLLQKELQKMKQEREGSAPPTIAAK